MKIGILTLTLHSNYGGILQAYALQTMLERLGHEVEVLNRPFTPSKTERKEIPKRIIKKLLGRDVVIFSERRYNKEAPIINKAVWDFRKKYIHERIINSLHDIKEDDYECIVVGSDQVWRPRFFKSQWGTGVEDAFLAFTKGWNIKRIAYAASFGVDTWEYTEEETRKCKEAIKMFDFISVREGSGIKLLKDYLGVNSSIQVLDPTLLQNKDDYISLFEKAQTPPSDGSLLIYMLDVNNEKRNLISKIAEERSLKPFTINKRLIKQTSPVKARILPSIETWLRGFYDAELIVTDSFHACVFSIIFGKSFITLGNEERGMSRFQSLFSMFSLDYHLLGKANQYSQDKICTIDKSIANRLQYLRQDSITHLNEALSL